MPASSADQFATDTQGIDYLGRARELAPALAAAADEIERRHELPEPVVNALVERGLFRMLLPRSLGGAELLPADFVPVIEEIAKADASTAWCLNQASGCSMTAAYLDPAAAREIFGGTHGILAWGPGPGTARVVKGGYRVTASWSFASGSHNATWLGCHVPVVEADGTPRLNPDCSPVIRTMLFPKSNAQMTDIWRVIGLKGTGSDRFSVEDLFVPQQHSATRDDDTRREGGCSIASAASSSMQRGLPGWRWGSPAARSTPLWHWHTTRCRSARRARCATTICFSRRWHKPRQGFPPPVPSFCARSKKSPTR